MFNSITATIFAISISSIALSFSSRVLLYDRALSTVEIKLERSLGGEETIASILTILNRDKKQNLSDTFLGIRNLESPTTTIELCDISSKIDLNFIDFTLFKQPYFKALLRDQFNWLHLEEFRQREGFINSIEPYRHFFKESTEFENLFTAYSIANINNISDNSAKKLYQLVTENRSEAEQLKDLMVNRRIKGELISKDNYTRVLQPFNKDIKYSLSVTPSWNINLVDSYLLKAIMSKYNKNYNTITTARTLRELSIEDLVKLLNLDDESKTLSTYLGDRTTFWQATIIDLEYKVTTTVIFGWDVKEESYRVITIKKELL